MIQFGTLNLYMMDLMNFTVDYLLILTTGVAFGHLVNLSMEESEPSDSAGETPHDVQPSHSEGP
jgi:hypothetical protein